MKANVAITKSVGKYGANLQKDVLVIQNRINQWIAAGKLPGLPALAADGQCGAKTKQAIGAFQLRYIVGVTKPDCRADPGGKTVTHLGLDFGEVSKQVGDPVYDGWMNTPVDTGDVPYWEKRGMFWYGVGLKAGGGFGLGIGKGCDVTAAAMYNLKNESNRFMISALTTRRVNVGIGFSGSVVLCFATGIYHPNDFKSIQSGGWDISLAVGTKWLSLAKWVAKVPKIDKLVSAMTLAKYASSEAVSELATVIKAGLGGFGLSENDPMPAFVAIDLPFLGGGTEASLFYGVTQYDVLSVDLT